MSLKGKLETFYFASLLQFLSHDKKTGVLELNHDVKIVKIFIKDGIIVFATSSQKERSLGHLIRKQGMISENELQKCLQAAKETKRKLGTILVEKGYVSTETLKKMLHHQVTEVLYDVFLWKAGEFNYKDVSINVEGKLVTQINTIGLVLEASRRIDEWSIIKKQITNDKLIFKISETTQDKKEIKLNNNEWRILSLIDGSRTVRQVVNKSGYDEYTAYKIFCSLLLSGLIEESKEAHEKTGDIAEYSRIITIYNDILQVICKNMESELGNRVFTIFDECKIGLSPEQSRLFEDFDLRKPADTNTDVLLKAVDAYEDLDEGCAFLRQSFNALLLDILYKEADLLGLGITQKTLKDTKQALTYVKQHQKDSTDKVKIVHEIEDIMAKIGHGTSDKNEKKANPGGIASLLRLK